MNNVSLTGRLTKDVEIRKTTTGKSVASFSLAVRRDKEKTDFINCVAWNNTADLLYQYTHKGSQIGVSGSIQTRNYDDPNRPGVKVYVTEVLVDRIEFLEKREDSQTYYEPVQTVEQAFEEPTITITDESLPF